MDSLETKTSLPHSTGGQMPEKPFCPGKVLQVATHCVKHIAKPGGKN